MKPCPYCGCDQVEVKVYLGHIYHFVCPRCKEGSNITANSKEEAVNKWNSDATGIAPLIK